MAYESIVFMFTNFSCLLCDMTYTNRHIWSKFSQLVELRGFDSEKYIKQICRSIFSVLKLNLYVVCWVEPCSHLCSAIFILENSAQFQTQKIWFASTQLSISFHILRNRWQNIHKKLLIGPIAPPTISHSMQLCFLWS